MGVCSTPCQEEFLDNGFLICDAKLYEEKNRSPQSSSAADSQTKREEKLSSHAEKLDVRRDGRIDAWHWCHHRQFHQS